MPQPPSFPEPDKVDWTLIGRHLAGAPWEGDEERLAHWLASDTEATQVLASARAAWNATPASASWDVDDLARRIRRSITREAKVPTSPLRQYDRPGVRSRSFAAIALAAGLAIVAFGVDAAWRVYGVNRGESTAHVYTASQGQRLSLKLVDGTRVMLAPGSRLQTPVGYGGQSREVNLQGEAFFAVVHDAHRPFAVHAAYTTTRDIGTRFNVRAFAEDTAVQVAVRDGRVQVLDDHQGVVELAAGDMSFMTSLGATMIRRNADISPSLAWMQGTLVFDNTPLHDVALALSRWYDLHVTVADTVIARRRLTASFGQSASLTVVLEAIARSLEVQVDRHDSVVVFRVRGPKLPAASIHQVTADAAQVLHRGSNE